MSYPINDIFEGIADLLMKHGEYINSYSTPNLRLDDTYIIYGSYTYKLRYVGGELREIIRITNTPLKEGEHGKN